MIHAAARGEPYACFVRPDTRIPFMAMPDAIDALLALAAAPRERLTRTAYNLTAFNPTAQEIHDVVTAAFPRASLGWTHRSQAAGDRRFVAGGRRRHRRAARLGLRAALRFPPRVRRVSDSDHSGAVPRMRLTHWIGVAVIGAAVAAAWRTAAAGTGSR